MTAPAGRLQDRKRRAVREDIADTAERLFLARGYEATTIDDIAAECGMSMRTVYRYFPAKDDILVSRFTVSVELLLETVRSRPPGEPVRASLRAAFAPLTRHVDDRPDREAARALHQAIFSTPALLGRYLQHLHEAQREVAALLRDPPIVDDVVLPATVAAAFACFVSAQEVWSRDAAALSLSSVFDRAIDEVLGD
ncbi:TetR/AcrR family transcriptional regulator [Catenuloplanes japonicus]|uniref:TetR/AcrR family transcriptional regulator n=1 Tax=Catenuloplanes japonicus TaxID=33876 RepID=UPI000690F0F0|nr:TetR/AcrR family transcriptional regulator [Catenuloplanes japonicus]